MNLAQALEGEPAPISATSLHRYGQLVKMLLPRAQAILSAIVQLARAMGLRTVAECVESDAIREITERLGVEYGQARDSRSRGRCRSSR